MMGEYADKMEKTHVVMIFETVRQSTLRDLTTVAIFLALWSFGYYVGSPSLEWVGVVISMFILFMRVLVLFKIRIDTRMTPNEARAWLDLKFPGADE